MKKDKSTYILVLIFFIGLSVLLYPIVSDYWNSRTQTKAIIDYEAALANLKPEDFTAFFEEAEEYNSKLRELSFPLIEHKSLTNYKKLLNVANKGVIGYVNIDKIKVKLPIYHGTSDAILNIAVGHFEGSSLPTGETSNHVALTAHRGLPTSKLFTNLDKLEEGDHFEINVLDKVLTYQVDQVKIVTPDQVNDLKIIEGEDYVTLITCTPYGINTHRILVRGVRTDSLDRDDINVAPDAFKIDPILVVPIIAAPMLLGLLIMLLRKTKNESS